MTILYRLLALLCFCTIAPHAAATTELKFLTEFGYVGFAVEDSWPIVSMQSKLPIAVATFQIPNEADEDTPDSTNLAIVFYQHGDATAEKALSEVGELLSAVPPAVEEHGAWKIYRQRAMQASTWYTVLDARRELEKGAASVRLAWPELAGNAPDYDAQMRRTFDQVLASIHAFVGQYSPKPGEVIRRPSS